MLVGEGRGGAMQRPDVLHLAAREPLRWILGGLPAMAGPDLTKGMSWPRDAEGERPPHIPTYTHYRQP